MGKSNNVEHMILNIPSDLKYLGAVDAAISGPGAGVFVFPDAVNDVSTALVEACSNAIEHGNHFAKDKRVVDLAIQRNTFVATVKDEGGGFDFEKALRDESGPDPMSERGRGDPHHASVHGRPFVSQRKRRLDRRTHEAARRRRRRGSRDK
jgi:anti-sigma regulatory factor (Ser/Thr protein kinase)